MSDLIAQVSRPLAGLAPRVLSKAADGRLPNGLGGFRLSSCYSNARSTLSRRQFTGKATLNLHDPTAGEAVVAISDVGSMSLAYIKSTGHDVVLSELQRPNLLVPVKGTLSSRNEHMRFKRKDEPWILIGRGTRETTVLPDREAHYEAFVLSMPSRLLGDRLSRVEARGGMVWGDVSKDEDLHLARLTLALATQVALAGEREIEAHLAEAWTTVVTDQVKGCLDAFLGPASRQPPGRVHALSLKYVRKAEELIYDRPDEIGSLRDIARHVGISERTLQTAFRKVRGATPTQVLSQARLHCARRALLDSNGPTTVSDVCQMYGIEHHGRFSKLYKEVFGEQPVATLNSRRTT
ncbi:helix-turn-helix transcriptional regulator [Pseudoruegeria sp. SHC-113]|uniref:helix-turn-helix transcriptional regulator n=1 Tax=Pseudoruegeria sp. SHC-113 TaxID=2855439 RepID=UPI0021BAC52A|nr:helix-turn-helix transcriptional regulator [Pseudoruegeria sp. SHC-113]MCT8160645.1 helix-turn-helix transcriptional regulator [Pseudoruegeria sp. SHC-113]